ncbi:MAG: penicillin-binding transpeptidase domain-containing protein [Ilumatobacteraceae bacterium]
MYSHPTYDPNDIAVHDTKAAGELIDYLNSLPEKPLLANAYQERYMPGSTFKVITTTIALETGAVTLDSFFPDEARVHPALTTDPIMNYGGSVCGGDFTTVFARSCNTPFARLAVQMGAAAMVDGADRFGLNEAPPFDLPRPAASYFGTVADFGKATPLLAMRLRSERGRPHTAGDGARVLGR